MICLDLTNYPTNIGLNRISWLGPRPLCSISLMSTWHVPLGSSVTHPFVQKPGHSGLNRFDRSTRQSISYVLEM